jgi:anaerobic selenocysteine-containing dehydrogenase
LVAASSAGGTIWAIRMPDVCAPKRQIELAPPMLLQDLPRAWADVQTPAPEMVIIGRRDVRSNNSWMHNLPILAKGPFRCTALVHPMDAQRLQLHNGAMARISHGARHVDAQVELSSDMMPGVVSLPHGWGHDLPGSQLAVAAQRPGVNLNLLLDDSQRDPLSGNAVLSGVAVSMQVLNGSVDL